MTESNRKVTIGLIQASTAVSVEENLKSTLEKIRLAADSGAQIICTQELFKSPYFCQSEDHHNFAYAEEVGPDSAAVRPFLELAAELQIVIIASLFEKRAVGLYHNTAVVIDADGSYLGKYRKMHIPDDPLYYEKYYFTPGDLGFKTFKTKYADIGVLICWDQWYPEAARLTAMSGAEIIFIPTAIGYGTSEEDSGYDQAWETVQRGHAVSNACFLAAVNRVGFEPEPDGEGGIRFWGSSFVSDPYGKLLAKASSDQEEVLVAELNLDFIRKVRDGFSFPFRDRRVDYYHGLTELYIDPPTAGKAKK
jgi:N-carbamoylputrescine amidase